MPQLCQPRPGTPAPISVLLSQGLDDTLVHPQQVGFPAFRSWGTRCGCGPPTASYTVPQQLAGCRGHAAVDWWPIAGFNHLSWPCPRDPYWHNQGVWAFFSTRTAPTSSTYN